MKTTSTTLGFFNQNLHQDALSSSLTTVGVMLEGCSSSCESSEDLSFQLRGTHPLLTNIGGCELEEVYLIRSAASTQTLQFVWILEVIMMNKSSRRNT